MARIAARRLIRVFLPLAAIWFALPSGASPAIRTAVTITVDLRIGHQSVALDGIPVTDANGHARFGLGPVFQKKLHFACRYAGPAMTTGAGYGLYDHPYTLALTLQSREPQHDCTGNADAVALTYLSVEGKGPVVQTDLGSLHVGERWADVPAPLRKAAQLIEGFFEYPIEDPCKRSRALIGPHAWRVAVFVNTPNARTGEYSKGKIGSIVVMAGGLKGVPNSGPAC